MEALLSLSLLATLWLLGMFVLADAPHSRKRKHSHKPKVSVS